MSFCAKAVANNHLVLSTDPADCPFYVLEQADLDSLLGLNSLFAQYFDFDAQLFSIVVGASLLSFTSGHILGAILRVWRRGQ